jgi:hypothetical protein
MFEFEFATRTTVNRIDGPQILSFTASPSAGPDRYLTPNAMKSMGGIIFMGVASPSVIPNACPSLRIDLTRSSGTRLAVRFSESTEVHKEIFDWELIPTAEYVKSGEHALFSYMGVRAEYHKAFSDNLVGLNLFLLDNSRRWERFPYAHLFLAGPPIAGYPQNQPTDGGLAAWDRLRAFLGSEQLMFFDRGVKFFFSADSGRLSISGAPYWVAVEEADRQGNGRVIRAFTDTAAAKLANPTIFDSAYRISKYSAFFRYMAQFCPKELYNFWANLEANRGAMTEVVVPPGKMWDRARQSVPSR